MKMLAPPIDNHVVGPAPPSNESSSLLDCQTAFQQVATECVRLVQRNRKEAIAGDPTATHKMRIELTKLRAMVRFFSPMMKDEAWPRLKKELRWLNSSLGKARDHDVTMDYAQRKRYRSWARAVARSLACAKEKNHRSLAKKLDSDRYEGVILALKHWITTGPWLSNRLPLRSERLEVFSSARLCDWRAAISRKGRKLGALRRQQLHRVRIRAKHYRYCIDALQELGINITPVNLAFYETAKQMHRALGDLRDLKRLRRARRGQPPGYRERKKRLLQRAEKPFRRQKNPSHVT
jgi:CHAD domain-containing protein